MPAMPSATCCAGFPTLTRRSSASTELTRDHVEGYLAHLHDYINPRNGKPLAARSRHVYISPLPQFSRETSHWGWDDVPSARC